MTIITPIIICVTVILCLNLVVKTAQGIVLKHLDNKRSVYKDMDVLFTSVVYNLENLINKKYPEVKDINDEIIGEVASIKSDIQLLRDTLSDYEKMKEDLKDIQAKSNSIQIGKAFMPSRRS